MKNSFEGIFAHTSRIKSRILDQSNLLRERDIHVIPDPVELPRQRLSKEAARERLGIDGPTPIYLFFGGLRPEKGPQLLLDAIKRVNRDATLVIAGSEGEIGKEEIIAANQESNVTIDFRLEFIPDSEIYTYFFACDVVVLPYRRDYYGTSGILQRAAAAGRPVISTDVGEVGQLTESYGLGRVVGPDAKSISRELEIGDEMISTQFESRLLRYAESHSVDRFVNAILEVYRDIA